jgi:hypothetical protein
MLPKIVHPPLVQARIQAPHVQRAMVRAAQAKLPELPVPAGRVAPALQARPEIHPPARQTAQHVQRSVQILQPKPLPPARPQTLPARTPLPGPSPRPAMHPYERGIVQLAKCNLSVGGHLKGSTEYAGPKAFDHAERQAWKTLCSDKAGTKLKPTIKSTRLTFDLDIAVCPKCQAWFQSVVYSEATKNGVTVVVTVGGTSITLAGSTTAWGTVGEAVTELTDRKLTDKEVRSLVGVGRQSEKEAKLAAKAERERARLALLEKARLKAARKIAGTTAAPPPGVEWKAPALNPDPDL